MRKCENWKKYFEKFEVFCYLEKSNLTRFEVWMHWPHTEVAFRHLQLPKLRRPIPYLKYCLKLSKTFLKFSSNKGKTVLVMAGTLI